MNAQTLTRSLKGQWHGGYGLARCPAHDDRNPSLSISTGTGGALLVKCFAGCSQAAVIAALGHLGHWSNGPRGSYTAPREPAYMPGNDDAERIRRALALWAEASPSDHPILRRYFESRHLAPGLDLSHAIGFHTSCPFRLDDGTTARLPTMLGLFRDIVTNVPCGIHRTALKADGSGKAVVPGLGNPKKMLGRARRAAIKLSPDAEVTGGLAISEGVENALSAMSSGLAPAWSMGSAGALAAFPVLAGIESLTILADHDRVGIDAARACAVRWADAGREATVTYPPAAGADWNDMRAAS